MGGELYVYVGKEDDDNKVGEECSICLDQPASCILVPCGHKACCSTSSCKRVVRDHGKCPLCRTAFEGMTDLSSKPKDAETSKHDQCTICLDKPATCMLVPCGHRVCCSSPECKHVVRKHGKCPLCRTEMEAISDSQGSEMESMRQEHRELGTEDQQQPQVQDGDEEEEEEEEEEREREGEESFEEQFAWRVIFLRVCISVVLFFATPFVLLLFLRRRYPEDDFTGKVGLLLVDGLKYYSMLVMVMILYFLLFRKYHSSLDNGYGWLATLFFSPSLTYVIPWTVMKGEEGRFLGAESGFAIAAVIRVFAVYLTFCVWPSYKKEGVERQGVLATLTRGVLASAFENVFTAFCTSFVLVPDVFDDVDNSIRNLCLLSGSMTMTFYCPLLTNIFPDLLENLTIVDVANYVPPDN